MTHDTPENRKADLLLETGLGSGGLLSPVDGCELSGARSGLAYTDEFPALPHFETIARFCDGDHGGCCHSDTSQLRVVHALVNVTLSKALREK